jgi:hypothetical protein
LLLGLWSTEEASTTKKQMLVLIGAAATSIVVASYLYKFEDSLEARTQHARTHARTSPHIIIVPYGIVFYSIVRRGDGCRDVAALIIVRAPASISMTLD